MRLRLSAPAPAFFQFETSTYSSFPFRRRSEDRAENFAAEIAVARFRVGHDALRRRHDGDSEPVAHPRNVANRGIDPPAGLGDPLDFANHRLAVIVFQL